MSQTNVYVERKYVWISGEIIFGWPFDFVLYFWVRKVTSRPVEYFLAREKKANCIEVETNVEKLFIDLKKLKVCETIFVRGDFFKLLQLHRSLTCSDTQGLWELLLHAVQKLQRVFAVLYFVNCQRRCLLCLENITHLSKRASEVHKGFLMGKYTVERYNHKFTSVSLNMELEQTINRNPKRSSGTVEHTKQK